MISLAKQSKIIRTGDFLSIFFWGDLVLVHKFLFPDSEEDKRATTNVQNGLVFFFLFSFILLSLN